MVFVISLEDAATKLHFLDVQALFLQQAAPLYQKKEDHWLHFSSITVKIFQQPGFRPWGLGKLTQI